MKTSIEHLPEEKQYQLQRAVAIILESVNPDMLILFGSYARGNWVEELAEDQVHYKYQSDFDLLAIVKHEAIASKIERKDSLQKRLFREIKTPVSLIAEDIHFVNRRISSGQYFYTDILKEGVLLHDSGKLELSESKELTQAERKRLAEEDYKYWFNNASEFMEYYDVAIEKTHYKKAAFYLHQATESFYGAILLVYTRYKPSTHDLTKLIQRVASIEPQFLQIFPQSTEEEIARFKLLRKAYVDARYKPAYHIDKPELEWLAERVLFLQDLCEKLCQEKIAEYS